MPRLPLRPSALRRILGAPLLLLLAAAPAVSEPAQESRDHVLALSWQPAFCETRGGRRQECDLLNRKDIPVWAGRFTLHGLWPRDGEYCGVPGKVEAQDRRGPRFWAGLPMQALPKDLRDRLLRGMPGALSALHKHEWIRHGTCHGDPDGAAGYFEDSLAAMQAINRSGIAKLMQAHAGRELSADQLRAALDRAFGRGAGKRLQMVCATEPKAEGGRRLIAEIRVSLRGRIGPGADFGRLLRDAPPRKRGCKRGVVDPRGVQ